MTPISNRVFVLHLREKEREGGVKGDEGREAQERRLSQENQEAKHRDRTSKGR